MSSPHHGEYLPRVTLQLGQLWVTTFMLSMQKGMRQQPRTQPKRQMPAQTAQVINALSDTVLEVEVRITTQCTDFYLVVMFA